MRTRTLAIALGLCGFLAGWPIPVWAIARFGWIDARFVDTLGSLAFSLPFGLAAAALALVTHGLLVNNEVYDLLELDEEAEAAERQASLERQLAAVTAGSAATGAPMAAATASPNVVTVTGGTAVASAAPAPEAEAEAVTAEEPPSKYGNKMAVIERNQGFKDNKGKKPKKAGRVTKSMANRGKYAAKAAARRSIRDSIRMPRF